MRIKSASYSLLEWFFLLLLLGSISTYFLGNIIMFWYLFPSLKGALKPCHEFITITCTSEDLQKSIMINRSKGIFESSRSTITPHALLEIDSCKSLFNSKIAVVQLCLLRKFIIFFEICLSIWIIVSLCVGFSFEEINDLRSYDMRNCVN